MGGPAQSSGLDPLEPLCAPGRASAPGWTPASRRPGSAATTTQGWIFWDAETWMLPSLLAMHPGRSGVGNRAAEQGLGEAGQNAAELGYAGTLSRGTGAGTGDLATECHSVDPPHCGTQIHLQGDIRWRSGSTTWRPGTPGGSVRPLADPARSGRVLGGEQGNANGDGTWSINNVAGPDEYSNGVRDGVFTNAGVARCSQRDEGRADPREAAPRMVDDRRQPAMPFDEANQVFSQYDGRRHSADQAGGHGTPDLSAQWPMSNEVAANTLDYAERSDPDGPAMTDAMHAVDSAQIGEPGCATNTYLNRSIAVRARPVRTVRRGARGWRGGGAQDPLSGSPALNFTTGSGSAGVFLYGLTGFRWRADHVQLDPMPPRATAGGVALSGLSWRGRTFDVRIGATTTTVTLRSGSTMPVRARGVDYSVGSGGSLSLPTRRRIDADEQLRRAAAHQPATSRTPACTPRPRSTGRTTVWAPGRPRPVARRSTLGAARRSGRSRSTGPPRGRRRRASRPHSTGAPGRQCPAGASGTLPNPVTARYVRVTLTRPEHRARRARARRGRVGGLPPATPAERAQERDEAAQRPPRSYVSAPRLALRRLAPVGRVRCMTELDGGFGLATQQFPLVSGCLNISFEAWRNCLSRPIRRPLALPPYWGSPTTGWPIAARWARIWCVRPVSSRREAARCAASTTSKWVTASRARSVRVDITVRLPRSRPIGASMVPLSASGRPSTSAVYSPGDLARLDQRLERLADLLGARDHEQPGGVPVEPVDDAVPPGSASASGGLGGPAQGASTPAGLSTTIRCSSSKTISKDTLRSRRGLRAVRAGHRDPRASCRRWFFERTTPSTVTSHARSAAARQRATRRPRARSGRRRAAARRPRARRSARAPVSASPRPPTGAGTRPPLCTRRPG